MQDILATRQAVQSSAAEEAPSLVRAILDKVWVLIVCVLIAGTAGAVLSKTLQEPRYTAVTTIFLSAATDYDPLNQGQFVSDPNRYISNQLGVIQSGPVLQSTIDKLQLDTTPTELRKEITLSAGGDSDVITIEATADTPMGAKNISDNLAQSYRAFVKQQVNERRDAARREATTSTADRARILATAAVYDDGVLAVDSADIPESPSSPQPLLAGLVAGIVGALGVAAWALYSQSWTRRRVGPAEASAIFGAPVLSEIPERGRISGPDEVAAAHSDPGDAYRMAAVGLDYIRGNAPGVFLVTAPHSGTGTSTTAINLAAAAADHGRRAFVIAVEDGTRPHSGENDLRSRVLLHDVTQGKVDVAQVMVSRSASRERFGVMRVLVVEPVQGHPVGDVQRVLDQLPDDTDLVVIDAPPLPSSSASFVLAGQVDAVVVVIDGETTPADLEELQRRCRLAGVTVAGIVRNRVRRRVRQGLFGGGNRGTRSKVDYVPPPRDATAPRGLPILTGGTAMSDGSIHAPYVPAVERPARDGGPAMPTVAMPSGEPGPVQGGVPAEMPWSRVTRISGAGGGLNGHAEQAAGDEEGRHNPAR